MKYKILMIFLNSKFVLCILASVFLYQDQIEMKWNSTELNWTELNWTELNWTELSIFP